MSVREISGDRVAVRVPVENSETVDVVVIVVREGHLREHVPRVFLLRSDP